MNALSRGLRKLEKNLVPPVDSKGMRSGRVAPGTAALCSCRRGRLPEEDRLPELHCDPGDLPQALVAALQWGRFRRSVEDIR